MKPQDIEIVQSVLEITGPISPTKVYDKAKELFERGEITKMFDYGGETPHQSVSSLIYTALNKGEELPFLKTQEKPVLIALKGAAKEPVLNTEKISAPSAKIAHDKKAREKPTLIALKGAAKEPVLNTEKISAPSAKIAHDKKAREKPTLIALKSAAKELGLNAQKPSVPSVKILHERDLHPFLTYMAINNENLKCYTKTIFHEESLKSPKGMDRWLYPDMVGVRFLHAELSNENLIAFSKKFDTLPVKALN